MFVGRPLNKSFFFTEDGKPILHLQANQSEVPHREDWCSSPYPSVQFDAHMAYAMSVSSIREAQARWPDTFDRISAARCSGDFPVEGSPPWIYRWYAVQSGNAAPRRGEHIAWLYASNVSEADAWYGEQLADPPELGCINDDFALQSTEEFEGQMRALQAFVSAFAPEPSQFERLGRGEPEKAQFFLRCSGADCVPMMCGEVLRPMPEPSPGD